MSANRFDRMEWAGAFGDLGTLIPFVVSYIAILKMDPSSIFFAFGASLLIAGLYYKTPFPVQPMKAIGAAAAAQAAQTAIITPAAITGAGLITGIVWLVLGQLGLLRHVGKWVPRYVVVGIVLGLGLAFMLEGIKMMSAGWLIAIVGLLGTILMLSSRALPAMFLVLIYGLICGIVQHPEVLQTMSAIHFGWRAPHIVLWNLNWHDVFVGGALLAIPQLPLTLGNAIIAITEENNRLFPSHKVTENSVSTSTGLMNLLGASVGGIPMCHGAGGMAGHIAFGAKTGGAPIILGVILLLLACFFGDSIQALLTLLPHAVLGVILFLTGSQLALGSCDFSKVKPERFITLLTAAFSIWNVGLAFVLAMALAALHRRGYLRL